MIMLPGAADSQVSELDKDALKSALDVAAKAEGTKLGQYTLVDQDGVKFSLSGYFDGKKPLLISYIYTSCPAVCPTITAELTKAVDGAIEAFGDRFNVLTIGFDAANDTPERLREYAGRFSGDTKFRFASSDEKTLERLLSSVGFFRVKKPDGSFDHIDMATVVRADGTIYKQVYSLRTRPQDLALSLEELVTGKAGGPSVPLAVKLKSFFYRYDPVSGKYGFDYPVAVSVFLQALVIGAVSYAVLGKWIKARIRRKKDGAR